MNVTRSVTPARAASRRAFAIRSGSMSTPTPRAPRRAAATTISPSPQPRSYTTSSGPTLESSSMACITSGALGTQTTSSLGAGRSAAGGGKAQPPSRARALAIRSRRVSASKAETAGRADLGRPFPLGLPYGMAASMEAIDLRLPRPIELQLEIDVLGVDGASAGRTGLVQPGPGPRAHLLLSGQAAGPQ